jgi:putative copper export protein
MNLEQTTISLLEQFPTAQRTNLQKQEQMLEKFGQIAFGGFGLVVFAGIGAIIYTILTEMVLTGTNFWGGILFITLILFAGLSLAYVIFAESLKDKKKKLNSQAEVKGLEMPESQLLQGEGSFEPAISITENTTEPLNVDSKTHKF